MGDHDPRLLAAARVVVGSICSLWLALAHAQAPATSLTLTDAIGRALSDNPGLRAAGFAIDIETAGRDAASLSTPFEIEGELENFAGTGSLEGFDAYEATLRLGKVLELGDKRALRTELGDARIDGARTEAALTRLDLAAEVTRRFIRIAVDQERVELAREAVGLNQGTLALVGRRFEVGRSSEAELASAEIAVAQAELDRLSLERRLDADRYRLVSLWSSSPVTVEAVDADLFVLPAIDSFAALRSRIDESPDLLRLFDAERVAAAEQRVAESRARGDLALGFGLRHLAEPADTGLVFSVAMPLGSRDRATSAITEASSRRLRIPALVEQRRLELRAMLYELHRQLDLARESHQRLTRELLPRGERAVELYRQGFELGSSSLLELTEAQRELLGLRQAALTAAANYHLTLVDIEQLLGGIDRTGDNR